MSCIYKYDDCASGIFSGSGTGKTWNPSAAFTGLHTNFNSAHCPFIAPSICIFSGYLNPHKMAYRSFALLPLKLTKRPTFGVTEKKILHQGVANVSVKNPPEPACFSVVDSSELPPTLLSKITAETPHDEPTMYEIEAKSSVTTWEAIRKGLLSSESQGMPSNQACVVCNENPALIR